MDLGFINESPIIFWVIVCLVLVGFAYILKLWNNISMIKTIYIVLATFIGSFILYLFVILCLEILLTEWKTIATDDSKTRNYAIAFIGTVSGFGALFGVYLAIRRTEESKRQSDSAEIESAAARIQTDIANRQADTAEQGLITDRLNKANESLDKKDADKPVIPVRIGALHSLGRIAEDSLRDHITIMEMLCSYIRYNSPRTTKSTKQGEPLREDIQTALTVIGRRGVSASGEKNLAKEVEQRYRMDLQECDLRGAILSRANLRGARFWNSNMNHATFDNADLSNAWFDDAILNDAWFGNAKMDRAWAWECDFSKCRELTQKQLDVMYCGKDVKIPDGLTRPKHWPKDKLPLDKFQDGYFEWETAQSNSYLKPQDTKAPAI